MKKTTLELPKKPSYKKSVNVTDAITFIHFGANPKVQFEWEIKARSVFLTSFNFLHAKPEMYKEGFRQGMFDLMTEAMIEESKSFAKGAEEARAAYKTDELLPHQLIGKTDVENYNFYAGKIQARKRFGDGGLTPRLKCIFFMSLNPNYFNDMTHKQIHQFFIELKFILGQTDESQTRQWMGEIGFHSGQRGRPSKNT